MQHVFGPVSSKRLGQSLGVDLLPPKSCTWNCIYCQLGRTKGYALKREEFFLKEEVLAEIRQAVESGSKIDWITFVGSGETMLYRGIGWLVHEVKRFTDIPVAVITNGSLFGDPEVRQELLEADAVLPSLNAGSEALHQRISRPAPGLDFASHLAGLVAFRKEYHGRLWVEVMLLRGINDTDEALQEISAALRQVRPDMVHLVMPTRPASEEDAALPGADRIARAVQLLSEVATVVHPVKGSMELPSSGDIVEAVAAIASRHPVQEKELRKAVEERCGGDKLRAGALMATLADSNRFTIVTRAGEPYWTTSSPAQPDSGGR